jgi:beta-1,4-mannosyl-glycoprotein beta-1,4-N-acetylglucosaminyltransferase|tara:strand:+ start:38 stop:865 length:828 start_codon:yes stop_codon:yes gene_type:complete
MKIIDSFIFYNELDLLEYRLSILNEYVDYFILVESSYTFTGKPKKLYYQENKDRFDKFNHKIIHINVTNPPFIFPNINYNANNQWRNEYHQRCQIALGINKLIPYLNNEDIIITSDVDEIPNPNILQNIKNNTLQYDMNNLNRLELDMYYYNLNFRVGDGANWHGIKLLNIKTYKSLKISFQQMRLWEHSHSLPIINSGGWHLSYFGDKEFIKNKIMAFSHQEYNNYNYLNDYNLEKALKNGINLIGGLDLQFIPINENNNLPPKYEIYLKQYYN